jgi:ferrochelatase
LEEFLGDPLVIQKPRLLWLPILYGIILQVRPKKSAALYEKIWTDEGAPLVVYTKRQAKLLQELLPDVLIDYAFSYGTRPIEKQLARLEMKGAKEIVVIPLYPQYSVTTTGPIVQVVEKLQKESVALVKDFYEQRGFTELLAEKIRKKWATADYEKLILSYHGVPVEYVLNGDPYEMQCIETTEKLQEHLQEIAEEDVVHCYQSKFGRDPWIGPNLSDEVVRFAKEGVKKVLVVTPAFVSDCLETLEEICVENKGYFVENGGEVLDYVHPFNDDFAFAQLLSEVYKEKIS